ncbi:MAG: prolipoprotein diacylglyceryl transferase [Candidatus Riflebacteria bacterium]|nr:prolipoprotein diacylglyceryl transferase [Candidatus Riflebacteria bacterium]
MHPILLKFNVPFIDRPFILPTFGFFLALAFIAAIHVGHRRATKLGYDSQVMGDFYVVLILSAMVGARLVYVALEWRRFADAPWEALLLWRGGLVFYGGLVGAFLGCLVFCRVKGLSPWAIGDLSAPCIALGHMLGRCGCFFNGCCYGQATTLPWGMSFPLTANDTILRHPTQAYEGIGLALLFLFLSWMFFRPHRPGAVAITYVVLYAPLRFGIEMIRGDDRGGFFTGGLSISQLLSIAAFVAACVGLYFLPAAPVPDKEA